jgi:hypothetical protein
MAGQASLQVGIRAAPVDPGLSTRLGLPVRGHPRPIEGEPGLTILHFQGVEGPRVRAGTAPAILHTAHHHQCTGGERAPCPVGLRSGLTPPHPDPPPPMGEGLHRLRLDGHQGRVVQGAQGKIGFRVPYDPGQGEGGRFRGGGCRRWGPGDPGRVVGETVPALARHQQDGAPSQAHDQSQKSQALMVLAVSIHGPEGGHPHEERATPQQGMPSQHHIRPVTREGHGEQAVGRDEGREPA